MKHCITFLLALICTASFCQQAPNDYDENGKRHGYWKTNFKGTSQVKFEGNFMHGKEKGEFKFYKENFPKHPTAIMNFAENNDSVKVTYYTQKGAPISTGKMLNKKREGKWIYFHQASKDTMMTEEYRNNELNGLQKTYFTNGQLTEETHYQQGQKNGQSLVYSKAGILIQKLNFKDGELHGPVAYFDETGEKIIEGQYKKDRKTGTWQYFEDGKLKEEKDY